MRISRQVPLLDSAHKRDSESGTAKTARDQFFFLCFASWRLCVTIFEMGSQSDHLDNPYSRRFLLTAPPAHTELPKAGRENRTWLGKPL